MKANRKRLAPPIECIRARAVHEPVLLLILLALGGCKTPPFATAAKPEPPAVVKNATKEAELATITLTPKAEARLGIAVAPAAEQTVFRMRTYAGEVVLPPDRITAVTAPVGGTVTAAEHGARPVVGTAVRKGQPMYRLSPYVAPERDLQVQVEREVAAAETRVQNAKVRLDRAEQLLKEEAGSRKAAEQAREELDLAETDLKAARARRDRVIHAPLGSDITLRLEVPRDGILQKVIVSPGQAVTAGAILFEIVNVASLWVKVPIYVGELSTVDRKQPARIHGLADPPGAPAITARPVAAPPSADPVAATADLYFELPNAGGAWRPGQKVGISLATKTQEKSLVVPWSAILHDIQGGTWVYVNPSPQVFSRRPVEVRYVSDNLAVLGRGPAPGTKVVTIGAAELFGTEFGAGK